MFALQKQGIPSGMESRKNTGSVIKKTKQKNINSLCFLIPIEIYSLREEDSGAGRHSLGSYKEMDGCLGSHVVSVSQVNVPSGSQPMPVGQPVWDRSTRPAHRTTLPKGPLQQNYILRGVFWIQKDLYCSCQTLFLPLPRMIMPEGSGHSQLMLGLREHQI